MNRLDARTVRVVLWGVLFIWIGMMGVVDEPKGMASIGAGAIMLIGAGFRRAVGARSGFVLTTMGVMLIALGLFSTGNGIPLFAVALIAIGTLIVVRALSARRWIEQNVRSVKVWVPDEFRDPPPTQG